MTKSWIEFLNKIDKKIKELENDGCDSPCFRGHANKSWNLSPSLFIKQKEKSISLKSLDRIESAIYYDFVTNAGTLLKNNVTSWEILFEMRHHGIPTRLLDWTESFGTALFFALNGDCKNPCIWILDPYSLNEISYNSAKIPNPLRDLDFSYDDTFVNNKDYPYALPIAMIAPRTSDRLFAQKGLFTLQGSNSTPLDLIPELSKCITKFDLPPDSINDAKMFLRLAGINNYSIFPDLDGLAKYLNSFHNIE